MLFYLLALHACHSVCWPLCISQQTLSTQLPLHGIAWDMGRHVILVHKLLHQMLSAVFRATQGIAFAGMLARRGRRNCRQASWQGGRGGSRCRWAAVPGHLTAEAIPHSPAPAPCQAMIAIAVQATAALSCRTPLQQSMPTCALLMHRYGQVPDGQTCLPRHLQWSRSACWTSSFAVLPLITYSPSSWQHLTAAGFSTLPTCCHASLTCPVSDERHLRSSLSTLGLSFGLTLLAGAWR